MKVDWLGPDAAGKPTGKRGCGALGVLKFGPTMRVIQRTSGETYGWQLGRITDVITSLDACLDGRCASSVSLNSAKLGRNQLPLSALYPIST